MDYYILDGITPVKADDDLLTWAKWFEAAKRHVAETTLSDGTRISTVFLGLDHNYGEGGPPILFETMIFGGPYNNYCDRYATWEEAVAGHARAIDLVEEKIGG